MSVNVDVYIVDEIGARLDRVMAKVLAYNLQKWARRRGATLRLKEPLPSKWPSFRFTLPEKDWKYLARTT